MADRQLRPVMVILSDDDAVMDIDRGRFRRLVANEKEMMIRRDLAAWNDHGDVVSWSQKKAILWDLSMGRCHYCRKAMNPFSEFSVDHVVPRSKGGSDDLGNLVACCRSCNSNKGSTDPMIWRNRVKRWKRR